MPICWIQLDEFGGNSTSVVSSGAENRIAGGLEPEDA